MNKIKYTYNIGDTVKLTVVRNNEEMEVSILLAETPEENETQNNTNQTPTQVPNGSSSIFDLFR